MTAGGAGNETPDGPGSTTSLAAKVSDAITALQRVHYGKGPRIVRTTIDRDAVVVMLHGGFTPVEQTLAGHGRADAVLEQRAAFQETMRGAFTAAVAEIMGRPVEATLSAAHQDPDVCVEIFLFADRT